MARKIYKSLFRGIGHHLPANSVSNVELSKTIDTNDAWISERTGIRARHIATPDECTSQLGIAAAKKALANSGMEAQELDLIIAATRGRDMAVLFGDGAGACVLEAQEVTESQIPTATNTERGIIDGLMGGDGGGAEMLIMRAPGTSQPEFISHANLDEGTRWPHMEGRTVFKHAVTRMCESAETLLKRNGIKASDLTLVAPHQANHRISEMVREKLGLPPEKVFNNIHKYGNTTAATIPLVLSEAVEEGKLKQGDLLLTVAFGAGFTWGANLIRW